MHNLYFIKTDIHQIANKTENNILTAEHSKGSRRSQRIKS